MERHIIFFLLLCRHRHLHFNLVKFFPHPYFCTIDIWNSFSQLFSQHETLKLVSFAGLLPPTFNFSFWIRRLSLVWWRFILKDSKIESCVTFAGNSDQWRDAAKNGILCSSESWELCCWHLLLLASLMLASLMLWSLVASWTSWSSCSTAYLLWSEVKPQ